MKIGKPDLFDVYKSSDIPGGTEAVPAHGQAIYRAAFNSAHAGGASEASAHAIAWSAVKKKFKKKGDRWVSKDGDAVMRAIDKEFSGERRKELAKSGKAMPGGGFPIESEQDLKNAIHAIGRAKNPGAAKAHIKKRARALGLTKLLPENWDSAPDWLKLAEAIAIQAAWDAKRKPPDDDDDDDDDAEDDCGPGGKRRSKDNSNDDPDDEDYDPDKIGESALDKRTIQMTDRCVLDGGVRKTKDGYLVADARIARAGVQLYDAAEVGMLGGGIVRVYRPPEEVFSKAAMHSLAHRPITLDHPPEMVDAGNWKDYSIGHTGDEVTRDGDCVRVPMVIMDAKAIEAFEKHNVRELSVGYSTELKWEKGTTPGGEAYDAIQTAIRGNHLAVVPSARGGSRLRIGDDHGESDMKVLIDGQSIEFDSELAAKHVQGYIARLQQDIADAKKKKNGNGNGDDDDADEIEAERKKVTAEKDAMKGEILALKKQLEDATAKFSGKALDEIVKERTELMLKADAAMDGKVDFAGKELDEIRRMVVQAKLGDAAKGLSDGEVIGAFKALTANIKPRTGTDRLADSLSVLQFGGGHGSDPKAIKDAAYDEYTKNLGNAWRTPRAAQ